MSVPTSVALKLARAREHVESLRSEIDIFMGSGDAAVHLDLEDSGRQHVWRWTSFAEPPAHLALLVGDAVHNVRAALDHLIYALATQGAQRRQEEIKPTQMRQLQFPVYLDEETFLRNLGNGRLKFVSPDARHFIEARQPYAVIPDHPEQYLLWQLAELDNIDKHREVRLGLRQPVMTTTDWPMELQNTKFVPATPTSPPQPGDEFGRFTFQKPPGPDEVQTSMIFGVTIRDVHQQSQDAAEILRMYINAIDTTIITPLSGHLT
ncbi:hypothetical protein [Arthrobacter sp. H14-L1]|uniref:hypothetical protein n=1 Tax=Arthrobacter sp. H14-L1 TaxID=2996697 RepID=UPI00227154C3|nr:hypothetical protein [Arthrobacter sp. H14-L1]MCY0903614.1 hypothetical protein [Arthrobacter sp. H14-L1]